MYVLSNQEGNSGKTRNKGDSFLKWKINLHIDHDRKFKALMFDSPLPHYKALFIHTKC